MDERSGSFPEVVGLGQVGVRLAIGPLTIYIDPYLSNSVAREEGETLERLYPPPRAPSEIDDADYVLITHDHGDHCDLDTLMAMRASSPRCRFIGPSSVRKKLTSAGVNADSLVAPKETGVELGHGVHVYSVPAAHPRIERDRAGELRDVGYVLKGEGWCVYHAGDTSLDETLIREVGAHRPIDLAFLPVNERNFFRERAGIIGNMSVREAFGLAQELGVKEVVPTHWDMFEINRTYREEIELLFDRGAYAFKLHIPPVAGRDE